MASGAKLHRSPCAGNGGQLDEKRRRTGYTTPGRACGQDQYRRAIYPRPTDTRQRITAFTRSTRSGYSQNTADRAKPPKQSTEFRAYYWKRL